jgi:hypothetical protein
VRTGGDLERSSKLVALRADGDEHGGRIEKSSRKDAVRGSAPVSRTIELRVVLSVAAFPVCAVVEAQRILR